MSITTFWSPNQASIAQVETYTFTTPNGVGNTYTATINGKNVTYSSILGDTAALVATGLYNLLSSNNNIPVELTEILFQNPSDGVMTATANVAGTPFANVTVNGVANQGLVLSTGNGLSNGISTAHTTPNASPSDVNDPQNWLRTNLSTIPPSSSRALPANTDDVVVANSAAPLLWNLDRLSAIQFNTYQRWQSQTGQVGLPTTNPIGYAEWRATYFKFSGPAGSTPAGGLVMTLGYGSGSGPSSERYDLGSSRYTCNIVAAGSVSLLGVHTDNVITATGGVSVAVAVLPGEVAKLNSVVANNGATIGIGPGVVWATNIFGTPSSCSANASTLVLNAAPATLTLTNGSQVTFATDGLVWPSITAQGGCTIAALAGGTITSLTLTTGSNLDKSQDGRTLTITNHTLDGDSCTINDPLNAIVFTNAGIVKQQVASGPYQFTGQRTVKVT